MAPAALSAVESRFAAEVAAKFPASRAGVNAMFRDALSVVNNEQSADRLPPNRQCFSQYREVLPTSSHRAVPFVAKNPTKGMDMKTASVVCKFPSTPKGITKAYTAERVSFALQAWGKERASPIKCIRRFTGVDRKTAEAWWHGRNPPQTDHLLNLARNIPELKSEVRRLLELEQDQAEAFQREAIALLQRYAR